jgi:hypothetical protein
MAFKAEKLAEDDLDVEQSEIAELDAAIDEADAQIAVGTPGLTAEQSMERLLSILSG